MQRFLFKLLLLLLVVSLSGCAYFNTFYMAKRNFNLAESQRKRENQVVSQTNKGNYKDAIEAAAELIRDYPDSKYIDDSLFIIGVSYYRTEDYTRALTKFNEILQAFPDGEFASESKYYKALTLIETGIYEDARILLNELIASGTRSQKGQAGLALVDIALRDKLWDELLEAAQNVIDSDPEEEDIYRAIAYKGEALYNLGRYDECIETMEELLANKLGTDLKLKGNLQIALAKAKLGNFDESLEYLDNLQGRGEFASKADSIRLEIGTIHELKGDFEQALDTYRKLAGDYPDSLSSKEAWYRVGFLLLRDISKIEEANKAFEEVQKHKKSPSDTLSGNAKIKLSQIETMQNRITMIEEAEEDSLKKAQARFSLAELYTFSFAHPDSALTQYELIIEEAPETDFAVRSEYFLGLHELRSEDRYSEETDRELMQKIIDKYPDSSFSQVLKVRLGIIDKPPEVMAFFKAEEARLSGEKPEFYMPMYRAVADSFTDSKAGCQALFVMAYYYEHDLGNKEKAIELYTELSGKKDNVYGKEYIRLAKDKLEHDKEEPKLIDEIKKNIAYLIYERTKAAESADETEQTAETVEPEEEELTGYRKIRERNARIRSRYY